MKNTKVICTIGPASSDKKTIMALVEGGMNAARLNFSHGTHAQFKEMIRNIREVSKETDLPIAIIQDLQGPKIRIGGIDQEGIQVKKGDQLVLHTGEAYITKKGMHYIPIQYKDLPKDIEKGDPILIDDGKIELVTLGTNMRNTQIDVEVKNDGVIFSNKGINVPKTDLRTKALTEKDMLDLTFGIKEDVDYVALSFVRSPEDIKQLKGILAKNKRDNIRVIAKIERPEAMENLTEIITESDAVMVARGDLGIEIPAENVPIAQKRIILEANKLGKPVITATHVLNSMVDNPVPTRAEVSDAANAIFDHTDAIMLSNETAVGKYPIQACNVLSSVSMSTEKEMKKHKIHTNIDYDSYNRSMDAVSANAVELAKDVQAKFLVAASRSGYTAMQIAKARPTTNVIVFTNNEKTKNQLAIVWGINDVFVEEIDFQNPVPQVKQRLKKEKLIKEKDEVVICNSVKGQRQRLITSFVV
jgi:pyruvate kinase